MTLLERFQKQLIPVAEWTHEAHLRVALEHLLADRATALDGMRRGIVALNAAHGVPMTPTGGYHETLTQVWFRMLELTWDRYGNWEAVWERLQDKKMPLRFYSKEVIMSWEARIGWVEPDLAPLVL